MSSELTAGEVKTYRGQQREAALWAILASIHGGVTVALFLDLFRVLEVFPKVNSESPEGILVLLVSLFGTWVLWEIARMRGSTISVDENGVHVREWYGRSWSFPRESAIQVGLGMVIPWTGGRLVLPAAPAGTCYLYADGGIAYANLEGYADAVQEMKAALRVAGLRLAGRNGGSTQ